ncbi:MAG: helix-turn-helix transcriptional regulator [Microbacteriaceae bacterium]|nr:helix-turn-helix transcriptional regulator [Microbacteriaceae bacterium]
MGDIFDVISDPNRRELLRVLLEAQLDHGQSHGEVSVGGLVDALGLTQPTVSKHLKVLRDSGLVVVREEGQHRFYRLESEPLEALEDWLIPFLGADAVGSDHGGGATAFAAWAGSGLPKPLRKVAATLDQPSDAGAAVGRTAADASHQVRSAIEGATHAFEEASAKVEKKVIDPIREKLGRRGDGTR